MSVLLCAVFLTFVQDVDDLSGVYEVQGVQINGEKRIPYSSIAILKKIPDTDKYIAQWTGGVGNNITGIGFLTNGKLTFSWKNDLLDGITEYKIGPKGVHKGQWFTNKGIDLWHIETITYKMPWPTTQTEEPVKYSVKLDELYNVELYKDRVIFTSETWSGIGKFQDGKYVVEWTANGVLECQAYYERVGDSLFGIFWYVAEPGVDYDDAYEKEKAEKSSNQFSTNG